ncbi:MAG: D-alanyl-D-alanine carboxypeptidase/D-alanyl-D-alanine-endopeptidase, partial [Planctomycetes bacterium]|nr:D-alanyl-D-alanine carboxypeptidase/D-alanyl-D-alanine-endopeptidase [Planctomycetota bacterium]
EVLYRHRAAEVFAPASNMKLLTAAGVLQGLGAEYRFETVFAVENGELVVRASGDPNWLADSEHDPGVVFAALARELRTRNVRSLRGVRLEAGVFTGPNRPPTWPQDQLYTYYCAPTGAFVLEQGTFVLSVEPSGGNLARVALLAPPAGYPLTGAIREVASRKGAVYGAIDEGGSVRVRGKLYRGSPRVEIRTATNDPERWFRDTLVHQLGTHGVSIDVRSPAATLGVVWRYRSPLEPALRRMLEDSSNFDAEQCLRVLGAHTRGDGSLAGGRTALRARIEELVGDVPDGVVIADGSGLSKENRLTPGLLVVAMYELHGRRVGAVMHDCLPVAGRSGTLRRRFNGTDLVGRVRAKTGWIRGASSLSGVVETTDGERRWFSILMSYDRSRNGLNKDLKRIQEEIVAAVDGMSASR